MAKRYKVNDVDAIWIDDSGAPLSNNNPLNVGVTDPGVAADASRSDHVHAHGNQLGGTLHAVVIASGAAGFMSGADKAKLDGLTPGAAVASVSGTAPIVSSGGTTPAISLNQGFGLTTTANNLVVDQTMTPTWTGLHTHQFNGIGTGFQTVAITVLNNTASTAIAQSQNSPNIELGGTVWDTVGLVSKTARCMMQVQPSVFGGTLYAQFNIVSSINGAAYGTPIFSARSDGLAIFYGTVIPSTAGNSFGSGAAPWGNLNTQGELVWQGAATSGGKLRSFANDGSTTTAWQIVAGTNLTTAGAKIAMFCNNGDASLTGRAKFYVDKDGNLGFTNATAAHTISCDAATSSGSSLTITGPAGTGVGINAGSLVLQGGEKGTASATDGNGGAISLLGGPGFGTGNGGGVTIDAGTGTANGDISIGGTNAVNVNISRSAGKVGFFGATAAVKQTVDAVTNNVTSGGVNGTIANYTDLTVYANDSAAIRNDIYQLARSVAQISTALRNYGLAA